MFDSKHFKGGIIIAKIDKLIRLTIGGVDRTDRLVATSLSITRSLDDYNGSIQLIVQQNEHYSAVIKMAQDVKVYRLLTGTLLIAGIADKLDMDYMPDGTTIITVTISSYKILANRRFAIDNITDIADFKSVEIANERVTGQLAYKLVNYFLGSEGITRGYVGLGVLVTDDNTQIDNNFNFISLADILNRLAKTSGGYTWTINMRKQFVFYSINYPDTVTHTDDSLVVRPNGRWRDITFGFDMLDYKNFLYVIGGKNASDTGNKVPATGNLYTTISKNDEIESLKATNGGSGRWDGVYTATHITKRADLEALAQSLNGSYGGVPYTLSFTVDDLLYNEGDFIYVDLPMFLNGVTKFAIDGINIVDLGGQNLEYTYTCTRRDNNAPILDLAGGLTDKDTDAANIVSGATRKDQTIIAMARDGLISHIDFTDTSSLVIDANNKVLQALDVDGNDGGLYAAQPVSTIAPTLTTDGAVFEKNNYMNYEQAITGYPLTVIAVYKEDVINSTGATTIITGEKASSGAWWGGASNAIVSNPENTTVFVINGIEMTTNIQRISNEYIAVGLTHGQYSTKLNPSEIITGIGTSTSWSGTVKEVLIYNRQLTYSEMLQTTEYLSIKHGIKTIATT